MYALRSNYQPGACAVAVVVNPIRASLFRSASPYVADSGRRWYVLPFQLTFPEADFKLSPS